jgi:long-chain acyl-CoA synthetase
MKEKEYLKNLQKLWQKNWPAQLPREISYPLGEILLTDYLKERAKQMPDKPCLIYYGTEITFKQLDDLSDRFASFLAEKGLVKGDRVAVLLANCPQFHIAFYGILKLGCVHVPANPLFKEQELLYEMEDAQPKVILTLDLLFPMVQSVKDKTTLQEILVTRLSDFLPDEPTIPVPDIVKLPAQECPGAIDFMSMLKNQKPDYPDFKVNLDDIVALNYTGGTTGLPKGCEHTQRDMIYTAACAYTLTFEEWSPDLIAMTYVPVFWIAGEDAGVILPIMSGNTLILLVRWDPVAVMTVVDRYKVTFGYGLVDNVVEMMEHPDANKYDLTSLKSMLVSSFVKKINQDYRKRWKDLTGCILRESSYGMTETHTIDTFTTYMQDDDMDLKSRPIFVGLPMPGTQFKIVDFDTKELIPLGEEGEIAVRTPSLMKSYWNNPEATKEQIRDGWLLTGDIGMLDEEGYLHFMGRKKEMLKVKGMSVFPTEIEMLLGRHPGIAGSGVIGRIDPEKGEVPVAFVTLNPDQVGKLSEEEIYKWCKDNMATYKVPEIRIVNDLPLTATGKVMKEELKKQL